jgi:hypothetical protein
MYGSGKLVFRSVSAVMLRHGLLYLWDGGVGDVNVRKLRVLAGIGADPGPSIVTHTCRRPL